MMLRDIDCPRPCSEAFANVYAARSSDLTPVTSLTLLGSTIRTLGRAHAVTFALSKQYQLWRKSDVV